MPPFAIPPYALWSVYSALHGRTARPRLRRRKQKENQEDLLRRVNDATLAALTSARGGAGDGGRSGRRISDLCAYKAPADVPHARDLAVQARPPGIVGLGLISSQQLASVASARACARRRAACARSGRAGMPS